MLSLRFGAARQPSSVARQARQVPHFVEVPAPKPGPKRFAGSRLEVVARLGGGLQAADDIPAGPKVIQPTKDGLINTKKT